MSEKNILKTIKALFFVLIIGVPLFYYSQGVYPYTLSKLFFFQVIAEIIFFLWLPLAISSPRYRPVQTPLLIAGSIFLTAFFLASLNGIDFWRSIWSTYERGVGFFAILHFAAIGLVASSIYRELPWRKIFYSSLAVSVFVDVIAFFQLRIINLLLFENPGNRPGSTFGNPTFMSDYLIPHIFLAVYLLFSLLKESGGNRNWRYAKIFLVGVAGLINVFTVFLAQTRGDILGLMAGALILFLMFSFRPPEGVPDFLAKKQTYIAFISAIAVIVVVFFATKNNPLWKKIPGIARFSSFSFSADAGSIEPRLLALSAGWQGFLEKPILGWGPENFAPIFDRYYNPKALEFTYKETHFDKPHNTFMEYADSGGIVLFLAFLAFIGTAIYESFKQSDRLWKTIFVSSVVSYCVSQFFIFETIGPLLMLYIFFGATDGAFREKSGEVMTDGNYVWNGSSTKISPVIVSAALIVALIPVYAVNFKSFMAANYQYEAFQNLLNQNISVSLRYFEDSIKTWSPYSWNFKRDYAIAVAGQYFNYPGTVTDEDVLKAVKAMEQVRDEHSADAFNHYALVNLYNEVAGINKKQYTDKAENEAKIALEISPGRQEIYFYLAKTKSIEGDYAGALAVLKKALDEDPKVADSHFYYGLLAFAVGDQKTGYDEIKTSLSIGREWKTFYEPRTVGGFFAEAGYLDEAIKFYRDAWDMSDHSDIDTEIKLGVAYFYAKQYDKAKSYLEDAVGKFDVAKSLSYQELEPILKELGINLGGNR